MMNAQQLLNLPFLGNTQEHGKLGPRLGDCAVILFYTIAFVPESKPEEKPKWSDLMLTWSQSLW